MMDALLFDSRVRDTLATTATPIEERDRGGMEQETQWSGGKKRAGKGELRLESDGSLLIRI